jgi:FlaA1/EpsC-like NDP-sugar epimerase
LYVPKIPSYRITDVAKAVGPECKHEIVGIRPGEKIHEEMITESDSFNTVDLGTYYAILPQGNLLPWTKEDYLIKFKATPVPYGFKYNSGTNDQWLGVEDIRDLIRKNIDPQFQV